MDGFEFAKNVRKQGMMCLWRLIAFETHDSDFLSLLPPTVVAELFKKPFSNAQLIGIVREYVGNIEQH